MKKRKRRLSKKIITKQSSSNQWKVPGFIFIGSLITIILILPTLIVVPFIQSDGTDTRSVDTENEEVEAEVVLNPSDSPFSVTVFRSNENTTENVPLEDYVTRVVASEMPADFELEALKAQSLAARTYIVRYLMHGDEGKVPSGADVTDTIQHQVYKSDTQLRELWGVDYNWKMNKIKQAVFDTKGQIITYDDQPIDPSFFSTSNGYTENSEDYWANELPYLRSVASPWDEQSPKFTDQKVIPITEVEAALSVSIGNSSENYAVKRTESNRVAEITIGGKTFSGRDVREALGLRSNDFEVEKKDNHLVFKTKGYGHGVGMSQYGANGMAQEGKNYEEIVTYYYQDVEINNVNAAAPKLAAKN
ncbi:stage II sporulation protein D [Aquibacillus koreensis]|uniref:Stage II sporulation protein D n=1 Tax=Aquibacillus koreensis TaxID=279446 RepID=A0A9X3WJI2_9BACI|nr:stage II sporulation protein D [Aquibacillus koreensis]MCT2535102.1 stage II sporulation protein D [Aquibacillus koreensis]MDC3419745.1 stage II sporulation protein D [Aquibacillus koreensis]